MAEKRDEAITRLLHLMQGGSEAAREELFEIVYDDLRQLAKSQVARFPRANVLQPTALVHESYCDLVAREAPKWKDRRQFFGIAAVAMHDVLVEQARRRLAKKRGGGKAAQPLDDGLLHESDEPSEWIDLSEAIDALRDTDPRASEVVMLNIFGGLTLEQAADVLEVSYATVRRDWAYARAFLRDRMDGHRAEEE